MFRHLLTIGLLSTILNLHAQDSLIHFSQLSFQSDFEKQTIFEIASGQKDYFKGLVSMTQNPDQLDLWRNRYTLKMNYFKAQKRPKTDEKYLKAAYDYIHEQFLNKYEEVVNFDQIFENGSYNCVTACALYGMAFDDLGIPYVVKETPTHVYIVAYPDGAQIVIETTDPMSGFKSFSPGFKENFVSQLVMHKLIDQSEQSLGVNAVFDKYYFTNKNLGIKELIALQYYNEGIVASEKSEYGKATEFLKKAYYLFPDDVIKKVLAGVSIMQISTNEYAKWGDVEALGMLIGLKVPEVTNAEIVGEFGRIINARLINKSDTAFLDQSYSFLMGKTSDTTLHEEFSYLYYYERGRMHYNRGLHHKAMPFVIKAYEAKPANQDAETLLVANINNAIVYQLMPYEKIAGIIDDLMGRYPDLKDNAHLGQLQTSMILQNMHDAYEKGDLKSAQRFQLRFETEVDQNHLRYDENMVSRSYSQGVVYYFKKGMYKNARQLLVSGLKYAPESGELKMRKYYLDRAQN